MKLYKISTKTCTKLVENDTILQKQFISSLTINLATFKPATFKRSLPTGGL